MPYIADSSFLLPIHPSHSHSNKMGLFGLLKKKHRKSTGLSATSTFTLPLRPASMVSKNPFCNDYSVPSEIAASVASAHQTTSGTTPTRRPPPPEAPPAYQPPIATTADNRYAFLSTFDTVFLIDDSGSMAGHSWKETSAALAAITPICTQYDADGIDIYFLNSPDCNSYHNITRASDVHAIFERVRPMGGTPTGSRLNSILKPYLKRVEQAEDIEKEVKPLNIIVITDGVPSDDVETVIINAAKKLDKWDAPGWQVGIQFFQVGNEQGAATALRELDDDLADIGGEDVRDMVDTVPWRGEHGVGLNADGILKVVLGAVHRKLDRKRESSEWRR